MVVLHYVGKMDRAGQETFIMNLFRKIDREKIKFKFLCTDSTKGDFDDEIYSLGGEIFYTVPQNNRGALAMLIAANNLRKTLKKLKPDVFHIHTHHALNAFLDACAALLAGIKTVAVHSHNTSALFHLGAHRFCKKLLPLLKIRRFACGSDAGRWMFGKSKFQILHNGLDTDVFHFSAEKRNSIRAKMCWNNKIIIGHVGRFNAQKNHRFLIDIFSEIKKAEPDAHLVLIGKGELEEEIRNKVSAYNLSDSVSFFGTRTDIPELYQGMDLFLFPSLFEGLPVVLVEAQATDLPCLISDTITDEAVWNSNTSSYSLSAKAVDWAEKAISLTKNTRGDTRKIVRAAGYDIADLAARLDSIYLGKE